MYPIGKPLSRSERLPRGVWFESYMGEKFELIIVAVRSDGRRLCEPRLILPGENSVAIAEAMWDHLETEDPEVRTQLRAV